MANFFPRGVVFNAKAEFPVLLLYRHILKAATTFPSSNRQGIIIEIKHEFREARSVTDEAELLKRRKVAIDGLKTLESFSTLDKSSLDWEVHLGK